MSCADGVRFVRRAAGADVGGLGSDGGSHRIDLCAFTGAGGVDRVGADPLGRACCRASAHAHGVAAFDCRGTSGEGDAVAGARRRPQYRHSESARDRDGVFVVAQKGGSHAKALLVGNEQPLGHQLPRLSGRPHGVSFYPPTASPAGSRGSGSTPSPCRPPCSTSRGLRFGWCITPTGWWCC